MTRFPTLEEEHIEWTPTPQKPQRRCPCSTILRQSNPDTHCELCKRKQEQKRLTDRDLW